MITITINGKEIKIEKPVTVLEAAKSAGIKIPTLCSHEWLEKYGGCRICLVEVEKMPRLQTSCTLMAADGMVINTETKKIAEARKGVLEFLLINHPLDCPVCDKAGECELQDLVVKYGASSSRFKEEKRKKTESLEDPLIVRNTDRCIMCTRCVRMCAGVQGASALSVVNRGGLSCIEPFSGGKYDCEYCGLCIAVCPVGAMMSRLHRHNYRPWFISDTVETICPYCGVGCTLTLQVRSNVIGRVIAKAGKGVNDGLICSKGMFGYEFVRNPEKLRMPLIRKRGVLLESTWEEAISLVARRLSEISGRYGSKSIGGIASPRCTNEDNYVFQKFMRVALKTNNIDSTARSWYAGAQRFIENILGQGSTANIISGLSNSDAVFIAGGDPLSVNPVLGLQIRACSKKGGKIFTLGNIKGFQYFNPITLNPAYLTDTFVLEFILTELKKKKELYNTNSSLEKKIADINASINDVEKTSGISKDELRKFVDSLSQSLSACVVIGRDIVQTKNGAYNLLLLAAISYILNARIYLLSELPNEQGVLDMGCMPDMLPGYRQVANSEQRKKYERDWGSMLPNEKGLTIFEMIDAAKKGSLKALYVMGENPVFNIPDSKNVEAAIRNVEFLVVQDIFFSETAKMADVVLPALSWGEKEGTFTNLERRIQRLKKAVHRDGKDDWKIICELSEKLGYDFIYPDTESVFDEISRVSPLYKGLKYKYIERGNVMYPYNSSSDMAIVDVNASKHEISVREGLYIKVEQPLFHSRTLSRKAPALLKIYPNASVKINQRTADRLSLQAGGMMRITTKVNSIELPLNVDSSLDDNCIMLSNNFEDKGAYSLVEYSVDSVTGAACIDANDIKIEKAGR
ncbi:MAG: molybdopterin-dependent oxidoreductase [Nitrospiraceae bacterium]|nr:molybdopterin-dependent oxidoreductase [Nitrospiraceae bacterium]